MFTCATALQLEYTGKEAKTVNGCPTAEYVSYKGTAYESTALLLSGDPCNRL